MKRIMRKNQVIITVLAVMIAIAGYLTYAGRVEVADSRDISMENTSDAKEAIAEYDTIDTAKEDATDAALTDIESLDIWHRQSLQESRQEGKIRKISWQLLIVMRRQS